MKSIIKKQDVLNEAFGCNIKLDGIIDIKIRQVVEGLYKKLEFSKMLDFFRFRLDPFAAGEFWGKIMRSAAFVYEYTKDEDLLSIIKASMADMLSIQDEDGDISTVPKHLQPNGSNGSDLWERKYVLLGMWNYYVVLKDEKVFHAMCRLADYVCTQVGKEPKTPITNTGWAFMGIESSSILEPIMKLYNVTGKESYLALAKHIVEETGCCKRQNIFQAVLEGVLPKDIGGNGVPKESIAKAYEMMSCFEGLVEYYRATGEEKWLKTALIFFDRLKEYEITLLGSGGADKPYNLGPGIGEQWNNTALEQTNPDIALMMETCVTITWMKLCLQMLRITGNPKIYDEIEISLYNALIGAQRPDGAFFDYFPKFNGTRNSKVNFTYDIGNFPLSCCTANGPAGLSIIPFTVYMTFKNGLAVNTYMNSTFANEYISLKTQTEYPKNGAVKITVLNAPEFEFEIKVRIPSWCKDNKLTVNDESVSCVNGEYASIKRVWNNGDIIELSLDIKCEVHIAPKGSNRLGDNFAAFTYGCLLLSRDARYDKNYDGSISKPTTKYVDLEQISIDNTILAGKIILGDEELVMIDYPSSGNTWDEKSTYNSWIKLIP